MQTLYVSWLGDDSVLFASKLLLYHSLHKVVIVVVVDAIRDAVKNHHKTWGPVGMSILSSHFIEGTFRVSAISPLDGPEFPGFMAHLAESVVVSGNHMA
jgi:hypothetical protein